MSKLKAFSKTKIVDTVRAMLTCYAAMPKVHKDARNLHTVITMTYHRHYETTRHIRSIKTLVEGEMANYVWTK